jgi:hypothetical protein
VRGGEVVRQDRLDKNGDGKRSRDRMLDLLRRGAIPPEGRSNGEETKLVTAEGLRRFPS